MAESVIEFPDIFDEVESLPGWEVRWWPDRPAERLAILYTDALTQWLISQGPAKPIHATYVSWKFESPELLPVRHRELGDAELQQKLRELADKLCEEHPSISTQKGIFGGFPHIKDVRLSVADVLSHLFVLGSIAAILERYAPDVTEEQIKEAIAYAQDFLEASLHP